MDVQSCVYTNVQRAKGRDNKDGKVDIGIYASRIARDWRGSYASLTDVYEEGTEVRCGHVHEHHPTVVAADRQTAPDANRLEGSIFCPSYNKRSESGCAQKCRRLFKSKMLD